MSYQPHLQACYKPAKLCSFCSTQTGNNHTCLPLTCIELLCTLPLQHDVAATMDIASDVLEQPSLAFTTELVPNAEWVEQIKASYVPLRISDRLYIIPEWSQPEDHAALTLILQPGVAFGRVAWWRVVFALACFHDISYACYLIYLPTAACNGWDAGCSYILGDWLIVCTVLLVCL